MVRKAVVSIYSIASMLLVLGVSCASAQVVVEARGGGQEVQYAVTAGSSPATEVFFYYVSKGNETRTVQMTLRGPAGAEGTVEVARLTGSAAQSVLPLMGRYTMELRDQNRGRNKLRVQGGAGGSSYSGGGSAQSECTPEQLAQYQQLISQTPELAGITPEQYCSSIGGGGGGGGGTPPPLGQNGSTDTVLGLLRKNTCGGKRDNYLVRMKVSLANVSAADLAAGFTLGASFREISYRGGKQASIKPSADGMRRGSPLLLMASISPYRDAIFQTRWNRGALRQPVRGLEIFAYASYRGMLLTRTDITRLLPEGGKATFEITDGSVAYSVCFNVKRARQLRNGYPANG